jgi:SAM-dependent methyltransferase
MDLRSNSRLKLASRLTDAVIRRVFPPRFKCCSGVLELVRGKRGVEIGGPSHVFGRQGFLPLYRVVAGLDNCNFSVCTVWEGKLKEGLTFKFDSKHATGMQYIAEATSLDRIGSAEYDFALCSHTLEHVANPLKALSEMVRVLRQDGIIILVLPHKEGTFDHNRRVSSLEHLLEDYRNGTAEDDMTHLPEILLRHDLSLDIPAGGYEAFKMRSERNIENRCLHHHVFDTRLAVEIVDWLKLKIVTVEAALPCHIVVIARKVGEALPLQNVAFVARDAMHLKRSPFVADRTFF